MASPMADAISFEGSVIPMAPTSAILMPAIGSQAGGWYGHGAPLKQTGKEGDP